MYRILYRFLASLARLAVRSGRSKDIEIITLRHQLAVLGRQHERPALTDDDRSLLGAVAQALPRPRRDGWLVTPVGLGNARVGADQGRCRHPGQSCFASAIAS
ncbi:MAG: hypothetical protein GY713_11720 [Actinomycetia bacterium]|nr:hypothetical protein [Actinomycetes bacterium]